jgi:hypothetical protein
VVAFNRCMLAYHLLVAPHTHVHVHLHLHVHHVYVHFDSMTYVPRRMGEALYVHTRPPPYAQIHAYIASRWASMYHISLQLLTI